MHWQKSSAAEQPSPSRPYQGVRVKEPVKELLKRKRGSAQNAKVAPESMAVFLPHQSLPAYSPAGQVYSETDLVTSSLPVLDEGSLYSGWLTQPPPATLQPLTQWTTTSPDYVSHEVVSCPYTADMFVQPVCPSYTLVGTSSVLTYTSQPLITNFAARSASSPAVVPHLDVMDQQAPLSYFPWTQPIPTLPATSLQYQPASMALSAPQFVPFPISGAEPLPQVLEDPRKEMAPLTLEKLLQEDPNDTYGLNNSLPVEGL
ncbi:POU domain class 2-associating factor 1 [Erythrolamprus reginae]|uniref:POU domain class 2-associating factor 1 n=1 Tax=Erythrolamprus reginae TaxID=121349 RepID=UPI00396CC708